jgi:hypothetical protein
MKARIVALQLAEAKGLEAGPSGCRHLGSRRLNIFNDRQGLGQAVELSAQPNRQIGRLLPARSGILPLLGRPDGAILAS